MGLRYSPYHACQEVTWGKDILTGDSRDPNNPFGWEKLVRNIPGTE